MVTTSRKMTGNSTPNSGLNTVSEDLVPPDMPRRIYAQSEAAFCSSGNANAVGPLPLTLKCGSCMSRFSAPCFIDLSSGSVFFDTERVRLEKNSGLPLCANCEPKEPPNQKEPTGGK